MNGQFFLLLLVTCGALAVWLLVVSLVLDAAQQLVEGWTMRRRARRLLRSYRAKTWRSPANP